MLRQIKSLKNNFWIGHGAYTQSTITQKKQVELPKKINMQIRHFPTGDGHKNAITQKAREEPKEM